MRRIVEPELMEDLEQAIAYDRADFSESHGRRVQLFRDRYARNVAGLVLDLGCGSGDVLERFAGRLPNAAFVAVDGSAAMLDLARKRIARAPAIAKRIRFVEAVIPSASIPRERYDVIMSHSLLHHVHRPEVLWQTVCELAVPATYIFVADLRRPADEAAAAAIVDDLAADEPEVLRRDFYNSLCAAFTPEEVRAQLRDAGLHTLAVEESGEIHLLIHGYAPATGD